MNFIIQDTLTLDIEHPISFCQDIQSNLESLLTRNYCNKFINDRFYIKVLEIKSHSDVFIQSNNSGRGSISCKVEFLSILYTKHTIIYDLDVNGTELNKNITVHKCTSNRYPKITFMAPYPEKINGTIPMGKILSIGINKASENMIIFDVIKQIEPILLPYDFTEELGRSEINNKFIDILKSNKKFDSMVMPTVKPDNSEYFVYQRGTISKGITEMYHQNFINIADRELCWSMLEKTIYNFIQY